MRIFLIRRRQRMKVLLLGGVAAGTKIAAKLMREDRGSEVIVLNK